MKIIVVGCGRMGTGLSLNLIKKGHKVTVIDTRPDALNRLGKDFKGVKINGLGFDKDVLATAEIDRVDAIVCCTESDEVNALIARISRNVYHVPRVVARLFDPRKANIYHRLGIQTISTTSWGIERATEMLTYNQLDSICDLGTGNVHLVRLEVPSMMKGRTVNDMTSIGEIFVVSIRRGNETFIPSMGTELEPGDTLYVSVISSALNKLKSMMGLS
ncbi:MAG: TrkA family potassium uptake protein [Bacillota bacterium]|nr:TrkA family potassium uptake protein [Bacillota bacterium]